MSEFMKKDKYIIAHTIATHNSELESYKTLNNSFLHKTVVLNEVKKFSSNSPHKNTHKSNQHAATTTSLLLLRTVVKFNFFTWLALKNSDNGVGDPIK